MTNPAVALDAVEEAPVWLEVNGAPAVTWMCTPERLDELVVGWLHGEGYIDTAADILKMRPCAQELGFWVDVPAERFQTVEASDRRRVLGVGLWRGDDDPRLVERAPAPQGCTAAD